MTFDWRKQPLSDMSQPQLAMLADDKADPRQPEAKRLIEAWLLRQSMRRPIAEPTDRYGRVTRREI